VCIIFSLIRTFRSYQNGIFDVNCVFVVFITTLWLIVQTVFWNYEYIYAFGLLFVIRRLNLARSRWEATWRINFFTYIVINNLHEFWNLCLWLIWTLKLFNVISALFSWNIFAFCGLTIFLVRSIFWIKSWFSFVRYLLWIWSNIIWSMIPWIWRIIIIVWILWLVFKILWLWLIRRKSHIWLLFERLRSHCWSLFNLYL
jgi:hypothetical protein